MMLSRRRYYRAVSELTDYDWSRFSLGFGGFAGSWSDCDPIFNVGNAEGLRRLRGQFQDHLFVQLSQANLNIVCHFIVDLHFKLRLWEFLPDFDTSIEIF